MLTPLKDKPLRNPGQSLDEMLVDIAFDATLYLVVAIMFCGFAMLEWIRVLRDSPPNPIIWTVIAIVAVIVASLKIRPMLVKMGKVKQGRYGEKAVGQYLENLRQEGAKIFHDIWSNEDDLPGAGLKPFDDSEKGKRTLAFTHQNTIDGESFDGDIERSMVLDTEEEWTVSNNTGQLHIYHIHVNPLFVTNINGQALPSNSPLR